MHVQLVALLHLSRVLAIFLVVLAAYRFAARFLAEERWRRWATGVSVAGGGLGWLVFAAGRTEWLGSQPLELYSPETFGFLAMLTFFWSNLFRGVIESIGQAAGEQQADMQPAASSFDAQKLGSACLNGAIMAAGLFVVLGAIQAGRWGVKQLRRSQRSKQ